MSILSSFIRRNSNVIQAIAKPLVNAVPFVGGAISDRMLMSPTPAQANAIEATAIAIDPRRAGSIAQTAAVVQAESAPKPLPLPAAAAVPGSQPQAILPADSPAMSRNTMLAIGGAVVLLVLVLVLTRKS